MKQQYTMEVPVHHAPTIVGAKEFSTGINGCFSDVSLCCLTCWCPCITFGRIAEIVDKGSSSSGTNGAIYSLMFLSGCHFMYSCMYRSKMRAQFGMPEDKCRDFVAHFCCERRALCQEYRELQYHGYDPALGWQGQKQNQGLVAPPMPGGMTR